MECKKNCTLKKSILQFWV